MHPIWQDVWIHHVMPLVLAAEAQTAFLETYDTRRVTACTTLAAPVAAPAGGHAVTVLVLLLLLWAAAVAYADRSRR